MNINKARVALLTALRKDNAPPVAARSRRASMAEEIQRATINTAPAVKIPSMRVRIDMLEPPTVHFTRSSSSSTKGSKPLTHNTMANHATQEMVRSSTRMK